MLCWQMRAVTRPTEVSLESAAEQTEPQTGSERLLSTGRLPMWKAATERFSDIRRIQSLEAAQTRRRVCQTAARLRSMEPHSISPTPGSIAIRSRPIRVAHEYGRNAKLSRQPGTALCENRPD